MTVQEDASVIRWKLHLKSSPEYVYQPLPTQEGRASFRAGSAVEQDGVIHFVFPDQAEWNGRVLLNEQRHRFQVEYYGGRLTTFELSPDGSGGTDLTLTDQGVPAEDQNDVIAGWVSVLMALKVSVDFDIDLRNHDPQRTWDKGYVEN